MRKNIKYVDIEIMIVIILIVLIVNFFGATDSMNNVQSMAVDTMLHETIDVENTLLSGLSDEIFLEEMDSETSDEIAGMLAEVTKDSGIMSITLFKETPGEGIEMIATSLEYRDKLNVPDKPRYESEMIKDAFDGKLTYEKLTYNFKEDSYVIYYPVFDNNIEVIGVISFEVDATLIVTLFETLRRVFLISFIIISGLVAGVVFLLTRSMSRNKLYKLAFVDNLTKCKNRDALDRDFLNKKKSYDLIAYLDADNFQAFNDDFGHEVGDRILMEFSNLVRNTFSFMGKKDFEIYRLQSDQFMICINYCNEIQTPETFSNFLEKIYKHDYIIDNLKLRFRFSVGILYNFDCKETLDNLYQKINSAMNVAKSLSSHTIIINEKDDKQNKQYMLEMLFKNEIKEEHIVPYIQPIVSLVTKKVVAYEILSRLNINGEIYYPNDFIQAATRSNKLWMIDDILMSKSLDMFSNMISQKIVPSTIDLHFNVSRQSFQYMNLIESLKRIDDLENINYYNITLEVLEQDALEILEKEDLLREIKSLGISIALDDFSAGESSIHAIKSNLLDTIKFDRDLLWDSVENERIKEMYSFFSNSFMKANINIVTEGCENGAHLTLIEDAGVYLVQGYYYSKPVKLCEKSIIEIDENIKTKDTY